MDTDLNQNEEEFIPEADVENPSLLIKKLRDKLSVCEAERKEYLDGWQRARADYANAEKRASQERMLAMERGEEHVFEELFSLYDDFERATTAPSWQAFPKEWREGLESIRGHLSSLFQKFGLEQITPTRGAPFDPTLHAALSLMPPEEGAVSQSIAAVHQVGFRRGEKVLRPAHVSIYE